MRATRLIMGMPIAVEIIDANAAAHVESIFTFFEEVDVRFSTYKTDSEISKINRGEIAADDYSHEMREIFTLAEKTKRETQGFFDIRRPDGTIDPSGIVKGWAIQKAAEMLLQRGVEHFFLDVGGDIQSHGLNEEDEEWTVGIRSPFVLSQLVKVLIPHAQGVATSGTYIRGQHIYNPRAPDRTIDDIVSLTVIGPNVLEADRYATAAFAMGRDGISFVESLPGFEGYMIDRNGIATMTTGFQKYTV